MTELRFYHLLSQSLDLALPVFLTKALSAGSRVVVRVPDEGEAERLNTHLWAWRSDSFLPHGSSKDGFASDQPIYLTERDENPNNADVLILTHGVQSEAVKDYRLCCDFFDGGDESAVLAARQRWKAASASGFDLTYWIQNEQGGWNKKEIVGKSE
jgi:DNA polymerase-3 subunit chi